MFDVTVKCDMGNESRAIKVPFFTLVKGFAFMAIRDNDDKRSEHVLTAGGVFAHFEERFRSSRCDGKFSQFF